MVAMAGRALLASEKGCSLAERLLLTAQWSIKHWSRYTLYTKVIVLLPHAAEVMALGTGGIGDLPVHLQSRLIELSAHDCTLACGMGAWAVGGSVSHVHATGEGDDGSIWEHEDYVIP